MKLRSIVVGFALALPALAQQSPSHRLTESVFNEGGHPAGGAVLASAGYRITLDSLGDGLVKQGLSSASWRMDASFAFAYPPPEEVRNLRFDANKVTLAWNAEPSVGSYDLYRGLLGTLSGLGYGSCQQQSIPSATTTDAMLPPAGNGFFYLVTTENRLAEEGTKGFASSGSERNGTLCP